MPNITFAGGNASSGFNMQMWTGGFLLSLLADTNTTVSGNASQVTFSNALTFGGPSSIVASGSFSNYNATGPQSGTVTSFTYTTQYFSPGSPVTMTVTGVSIPVASLNSWAITGNSAALEAVLFGGADTMTGGANPESIIGWTGNDQINGGGANDILIGGEGNDTLTGGDGDDQLDTFGQQEGNDTISGGDGNDTIGAAGVDIIDGGAGFDTVEVNIGGSTPLNLNVADLATNIGVTFANGMVIRNVEAVRFGASSGNDTMTINAPGGGAFYAGDGVDTFIADLSAYADGYNLAGTPPLRFFAGYMLDNVERFLITTGGGGDMLVGGDLDDIFSGGGGNDELRGGHGNDTLNGGAGDDTIDGDNALNFNGSGDDTASYAGADAGVVVSLAITGPQNTIGAGVDTLMAIERLLGSSFNDTLTGDGGVNVLSGANGNDTLDGGAGADQLNGGEGNDTVFYDSGDDLANVVGGGGTDTLVFTTGGPPSSFNLASHGFELAEGRFAVSGATFTDLYDGQWRLSQEVGNASNGSSWFIDWDETSSVPYQRLNQDFDASDQLTHEYGLSDNGSTWDTFFDTDGTHPYVSILQVHTAGGVYANEHGINDNGSTWDTFFDVDGANPFQWIQQVRDAFGVLAQEEGLADGGTSWFTDYDETGTTDYVFYQNVYDTLNRLSFQNGQYDTGFTWTIDYDETETQPWTSIRNDYDDHGVLIGTTTILDGP